MKTIKFRVWDKKSNQFWHKMEGVVPNGIIITAEGSPGLVVDPHIKLEENKNDKKVYIFEPEFLIVQQYIGLEDKVN